MKIEELKTGMGIEARPLQPFEVIVVCHDKENAKEFNGIRNTREVKMGDKVIFKSQKSIWCQLLPAGLGITTFNGVEISTTAAADAITTTLFENTHRISFGKIMNHLIKKEYELMENGDKKLSFEKVGEKSIPIILLGNEYTYSTPFRYEAWGYNAQGEYTQTMSTNRVKKEIGGKVMWSWEEGPMLRDSITFFCHPDDNPEQLRTSAIRRAGQTQINEEGYIPVSEEGSELKVETVKTNTVETPKEEEKPAEIVQPVKQVV